MKNLGLKWELMFLSIILVTLPTVLMGTVGYLSYLSFAEEKMESQLIRQSKEMYSLGEEFIAQNERILKREEALVRSQINAVAKTSLSILSALPVEAMSGTSKYPVDDLLEALSQFRLNRGGHFILFDEDFSPVINRHHLDDFSSVWFRNNFMSHLKDAMPYLLSGDVITVKYPWREEVDYTKIYRYTAFVYLPNWQMVLGVTINETDFKSSKLQRQLQNELRHRIASEKAGETGYVWVLNSQLEYVVSKDRLRDGENLSDITDQHGHSLIGHLIDEVKKEPEGVAKVLYYEWRDLGGEVNHPKAAAAIYLKEWDWIIGASVNLNDFYSGLADTREKVIYLSIVFIIVGSLIAYYFAELITRPVKHLENLAVKAAGGDLSVKVDKSLASNLPEIRSLSAAFSVMISSLNSLIQQKEHASQKLEQKNQALQRSEDKLKSTLSELEKERNKLHIEAITDPLTGLLNRRGFALSGNQEWRRHLRNGEAMTIAMIDIDFFKKINDKYGHATGDDVLEHLSKRLVGEMRQSDIVARIGGEEFAIILNQPLKEASTGLERLRGIVESTPLKVGKDSIKYTISIGVVQVDPSHVSLDAALDCADNNLYKAKRSGRNKVVS